VSAARRAVRSRRGSAATEEREWSFDNIESCKVANQDFTDSKGETEIERWADNDYYIWVDCTTKDGLRYKTLPILVDKTHADLDMMKATLTKGKTFELKPAIIDGEPHTHLFQVEGIGNYVIGWVVHGTSKVIHEATYDTWTEYVSKPVYGWYSWDEWTGTKRTYAPIRP